jgi:hypothetical protein
MTKPELPLHIDSTMIASSRRCMQLFEKEFIHGYRPKGGKSIDLHAGGCFAAAVEEVYTQVHVNKRSLADALTVAQVRFDLEWGDFEIPEWKKTSKTWERVWTAVAGGTSPDDEGYFQRYPPLTDHVQPYFNAQGKPTFEFTFAIPLEPTDVYGDRNFPTTGFPTHPSGSPFIYSGRLDMMGTYLGRPVWRDEKTSKNNPNSNNNWSEQWDLRSQFIGYTWALRQMGIDCEGGIVRGIGILKEKIGHAEAHKTYSQFLIDRWYEQLRRDLWRIRRAWDEGYWDYNLSDACTSYGNCMFTRVCQSTTPESWLNEFEIRKWSPLNKGGTDAT